jgi:hypothetical protein
MLNSIKTRQRFNSKSNPGFIVEVTHVMHNHASPDFTMHYMYQLKILQIPFFNGTIWTYKIGDILIRSDFEIASTFEYLIGQDKPIV